MSGDDGRAVLFAISCVSGINTGLGGHYASLATAADHIGAETRIVFGDVMLTSVKVAVAIMCEAVIASPPPSTRNFIGSGYTETTVGLIRYANAVVDPRRSLIDVMAFDGLAFFSIVGGEPPYPSTTEILVVACFENFSELMRTSAKAAPPIGACVLGLEVRAFCSTPKPPRVAMRTAPVTAGAWKRGR